MPLITHCTVVSTQGASSASTGKTLEGWRYGALKLMTVDEKHGFNQSLYELGAEKPASLTSWQRRWRKVRNFTFSLSSRSLSWTKYLLQMIWVHQKLSAWLHENTSGNQTKQELYFLFLGIREAPLGLRDGRSFRPEGAHMIDVLAVTLFSYWKSEGVQPGEAASNWALAQFQIVPPFTFQSATN